MSFLDQIPKIEPVSYEIMLAFVLTTFFSIHGHFYPSSQTRQICCIETLKLLLSNLPESAKIIEDDPDEKVKVKALLESLSREANTLKRHCDSLPNVDSKCISEMARLQYHTDGIASSLRKGWT